MFKILLMLLFSHVLLQYLKYQSLVLEMFTLQEEDLESQQGVIDFSLYLRNNKDVGGSPSTNDLAASTSTTGGASTSTDIAAVLDQKNYIEELNRHLK